MSLYTAEEQIDMCAELLRDALNKVGDNAFESVSEPTSSIAVYGKRQRMDCCARRQYDGQWQVKAQSSK